MIKYLCLSVNIEYIFIYFMARRALIAFHGVESIYMFLCPDHVVYMVKETVSFQGAQSINGHGK